MEETDPIEKKFKAAFSEFEKAPPAGAWENLRMELHPVPVPAGFWSRIFSFSLLSAKPLTLYISLSGIAILAFFSVIYFGSMSRHTIRGHAYAGSSRLERGTGVLFEVSDKVMPWDSVSYYRSAVVDERGHFQFSRVAEGKYLLRVEPEPGSEIIRIYFPTWHDQHETSDSCSLLIVDRQDITVEMRLKARVEAVK